MASAGDITNAASWTDANAVSPPADYESPHYSTNLSGDASMPFTFGGGDQYLTGDMIVNWTYTKGSVSDPGLYVSYSLDGGDTWTNNQVVEANQGVDTNGSSQFSINGATTLLVYVGPDAQS